MNLNAREAMYKFSSSYSSLRQVSLEAAAYYSLPELWLRKCFPRTFFANTSNRQDVFEFLSQWKK